MNDDRKQLALDVMTNAIETGAVGYWAIMSESPERLPLDDGIPGDICKVLLEEFDESTGQPIEPRRVYEITPQKVISAMKKISSDAIRINSALQNRIKVMLDANDYCEGEGGDAESDEVILQVACFGEIVYG